MRRYLSDLEDEFYEAFNEAHGPVFMRGTLYTFSAAAVLYQLKPAIYRTEFKEWLKRQCDNDVFTYDDETDSYYDHSR